MKPRRFPTATNVFRLVGGNEDNDLWVQRGFLDEDSRPFIRSVWELTEVERALVAKGAKVSLVVEGIGHPPVRMYVTEEPLGRPKPEPESAEEEAG